MKKIIFAFFALFMFATSATAQNKTAYIDVYARGGGQHLKVTLLYGTDKVSYHSTDLGTVLNDLGQKGWILDESLVIPRHNTWSIATRHKFHIIMKKDFVDGENPFEGLKQTKKTAPQKDKATKKVKTTKKK